MTDPAADAQSPEPGQDAVQASQLAAETLGRDLLSAMLDEIKAAPDCWDKQSQLEQDQTIRRLDSRVRTLVAQTMQALFQGEYPAIPATLVGVTFKKGIRAILDIGRSASARHELADSIGHSVLVVIADPDEYTHRMAEIRAQDKQGDLFNADAGITEGEGFTGGAKPYQRGEEPGGPAFDPDAPQADLQLKTDPLWKQAQTALEAIGYMVTDEDAQEWTEAQCTEAAYFAKLVGTETGPAVPPAPEFIARVALRR